MEWFKGEFEEQWMYTKKGLESIISLTCILHGFRAEDEATIGFPRGFSFIMSTQRKAIAVGEKLQTETYISGLYLTCPFSSFLYRYFWNLKILWRCRMRR